MLMNFSFVDDYLAGSAIPDHIDQIQEMKQQGITTIISLTSHLPLVSKYDITMRYIHLPVYGLPTADQLLKFKNEMTQLRKQDKKAVVHCQYGQERTGIFLAYYLHSFHGLTPNQAFDKVRELRPSSLRTAVAIEYVKNGFRR